MFDVLALLQVRLTCLPNDLVTHLLAALVIPILPEVLEVAAPPTSVSASVLALHLQSFLVKSVCFALILHSLRVALPALF